MRRLPVHLLWLTVAALTACRAAPAAAPPALGPDLTAKLDALTAAALTAMTLAGCGSGDVPGAANPAGSAADLDAALEDGGELTYWTRTPSGEAQAEACMVQYPDVTVTDVNAGTATEQYT